MSGSVAYANAYQRDRVCEVRLYASEARPLTANFVGVLGAVPSISSALWETLDTAIAVMSNATIDGNTTSILVAAQYAGTAVIRCTVSTDAGERYVQQFVVSVGPQSIYGSEPFTTGPTSLTATATPVTDGGTGGGVLDGGGA